MADRAKKTPKVWLALRARQRRRLRLLLYGASPMPGEVPRQAIEGFGSDMAQAYGMTEAAPLVTWLDADTHRRGATGEEPFASRLRSAGAPIAGVRAAST